jgi:hypothetical protein
MTTLGDAILVGIRAAILDDSTLTDGLGEYEGDPAVLTRVPVPVGATYPMIVIPPAVAVSDGDGLSASRPILVRDLMVYGRQPDHYRIVETLGYMLREKFHRDRSSFAVEGYHVIAVAAQGPVPAPVDDDQTVGRRTTLTIQLQPEG